MNWKGQSAIEYLMTYGWMLLVVAVVGGAIFAMVQGEVVESTSGFTGSDVQVDNFGVTSSDNLQLDLRNGASDSIEIKEINATDENGRYTELLAEKSISVGDSNTVTLAGVQNSNSANTLDVDITYDVGALEGMKVSGTISGGLELINDSRTVGDSLEVDHFERISFDDGSYSGELANFETSDASVSVEPISGDRYLLMNDMDDQDRAFSTLGDGRPFYPSTGDTYRIWFAVNASNIGNQLRFAYNFQDTSNYNDIRIGTNGGEIGIYEVPGNDELDSDSSVNFQADTRYLIEIEPEEDSQTVTLLNESGNQITQLTANRNIHSAHSGFFFRQWSYNAGVETYILGSEVDNTIE